MLMLVYTSKIMYILPGTYDHTEVITMILIVTEQALYVGLKGNTYFFD